MNKYLNIVLVSVFGLLSIKFNFALSLYIPCISYYVYKNKKNLILIIPFCFASIYFFKLPIIHICLIFFISLIIFSLAVREEKIIYIVIYVFIINVITYFIFNNKFSNLSFTFIDVISIIISPIIISFLLYNNKTSEKVIHSMSYNEVLIALIVSMGSFNYKCFGIRVSLILAIYYAMYLSSSGYVLISLFFSIIINFSSKLLFNIENSYLVFFIASIYIIPKIYSSAFLIVLCTYFYFFENIIEKNILIMLSILAVFFELIRGFIINDRSKEVVVENMYDKTIEQVDRELNTFSLFLDKIVQNFASGEYSDELSKNITTLTKTFCNKCIQKEKCFKENKSKLYYYYKNLIMNNKDDFLCVKYDEMRKLSYSLNKNLINKTNYAKDMLAIIINSFSNIIRQYIIDHSLKDELLIEDIYLLKCGLIDYGYNVSLFNIEKTFKNDFYIEVGIVGIEFSSEEKNITNLCKHYLNIEVKVSYQKSLKNKTYFLILPKTNYEVIYGYGSLAQRGNFICGDNYLVKQVNATKVIAIISDGMGKGLNANIQSTRTLKLLDEITNTAITSEASLNILNSFYYIQDYQEKYATIDFLEIDQQTGNALIYKAGSASTYIIHDSGTIEKIENDNLPFGLNEMVMTKTIKLLKDDLVIMASDGIFENVVDVEDFENHMKAIRYMEPQKIVYELLNYTKNANVISRDDMSVISLKIKCD